jgi:uncharacterized protein YhfF
MTVGAKRMTYASAIKLTELFSLKNYARTFILPKKQKHLRCHLRLWIIDVERFAKVSETLNYHIEGQCLGVLELLQKNHPCSSKFKTRKVMTQNKGSVAEVLWKLHKVKHTYIPEGC